MKKVGFPAVRSKRALRPWRTFMPRSGSSRRFSTPTSQFTPVAAREKANMKPIAPSTNSQRAADAVTKKERSWRSRPAAMTTTSTMNRKL